MKKQSARTKPYYSKAVINKLVKNNKAYITDAAKKTAFKSFGWNFELIKKAIASLSYKYWYKSEKRFDNPEIRVDYYRAYGLMGENVYTHFYIEEEALIIDSFKEI
jgi:hypothetical protein